MNCSSLRPVNSGNAERHRHRIWKHFSRTAVISTILIALGGIAEGQVQAQSIAEFYRGKTVTIVCGSDVGASYDLVARLVGRHLSKHIPGNPNVIIQNRPGAASVVAANYVYTIAPKDGTVMALVQRSLPFQQLFAAPAVRYDATKINWIGSTSNETAAAVVWHTAPQQTFSDLLNTETIVGSVGVAGDTDLYPRVLNNLLGTKFRIVSGYSGLAQIVLAMERGEIHGAAYWSWSDIEITRADWLRDKKIRPLLQLGLSKSDSVYLRDVPLVMDLARNEDQRNVLKVLMSALTLGRPFFVAPEVPQSRVDALREAFAKTMQDPAFIEDAKQHIGAPSPIFGAEMQKMIADNYALPANLIENLRNAVK
jgi:tripartite-type tricarboxylate transporter receptor subunit TctC